MLARSASERRFGSATRRSTLRQAPVAEHGPAAWWGSGGGEAGDRDEEEREIGTGGWMSFGSVAAYAVGDG